MLLQIDLPERERRKIQQHNVFEESSNANTVHNEAFFKQKLDYIHHNPISGNGNWWKILQLIHTAVLHSIKCLFAMASSHLTTECWKDQHFYASEVSLRG